ncbi:hypothetical protein C8J56DRAFT_1062726 [Mycena floridula]|nr:hypothetical protein C8J56DRAFT_1062726 [Mycena floridula]
MRDQDMADIDVTSPGIWERESDASFEDLERQEAEEEATGIAFSTDQNRPRSKGGVLTEQNLKIWLSVNPREPASRQQTLQSYLKSQRTLLEAEGLAHAYDNVGTTAAISPAQGGSEHPQRPQPPMGGAQNGFYGQDGDFYGQDDDQETAPLSPNGNSITTIIRDTEIGDIGRDFLCGNTCNNIQIDGKGFFVASAVVSIGPSSLRYFRRSTSISVVEPHIIYTHMAAQTSILALILLSFLSLVRKGRSPSSSDQWS